MRGFFKYFIETFDENAASESASTFEQLLNLVGQAKIASLTRYWKMPTYIEIKIDLQNLDGTIVNEKMISERILNMFALKWHIKNVFGEYSCVWSPEAGDCEFDPRIKWMQLELF